MNKYSNKTSYVKKFIKVFAFIMTFVLVIGSVPAYAASKKSVTVKTIKSLKAAMENENVKTITFKYSKKKAVTIPELSGSADKKLIISAPKASVVNKAKFLSISVDSASYKEEGDSNIITVKSASSKITVSEDVTVKKIVSKGERTDVVLGAGCEVESLECRKTAAEVSLSVGKDIIASVLLAKKTKIVVAGDTPRKLRITSKAKGSVITTSVPIDIFASKNISIVFEKGSEGSSVNASSSKVKVKITDNSGKAPVFKVDGKEVNEGVATPMPSATPSPMDTVGTEIITSPGSSTGSGFNTETATSTSGTGLAVYPVYIEPADTGNGNTVSYAGGSGSSSDNGILIETGNESVSGLIPDEDCNISGDEIENTPTDPSENKKNIHIGDNYSSEEDYKSDGMVRSYLFKDEGDICLLETQYEEPGLVFVERFDPYWELKESITLTYEPSLKWGGFYCGEKYNFIIVGQANNEEDDNKMVIRTIKYDKKWNEIGSVDLNGANTFCPFAFGSLRCVEKDGYLYVLTCHQQYKDAFGVNHQSNMMFSVNEEEMTMPYAGYIYQYGYVSHSFDQHIIVNEKGQLVTVDLGDGCPRAIQFCLLDVEDGVVVRQDEHIAFPFTGETGDPWTGATFGGIEETTKGYVLAFNHEDSCGQQDNPRNIYIEFASKYATEDPTDFSGTRICYSPDGNARTSTPAIVSLGLDNGGYVFWEEYDVDKYSTSDTEKKVCFVKYDIDGSFSEIHSFRGSLSDCKPILDDGIIYWYVSGKIAWMGYDYDIEKDVPTFYSLNTRTGEISIQRYGEQAFIVGTDIVQRETRHYVISNSFHDYFPLYDKDIYDDNGVLVETDYYNIRSELSAKKVYEYDEFGKIACERYTIPDNENGEMVFTYYSDRVESTKYAELYEEDLYYHTDTYYENGAPKSKAVTQYSVDIDGINIEHIEKVEWDEDGYRAKYSIYQQKDGVYDVTESWTYYESGKLRLHSREELYLGDKKKHSLTEEYYTEDGQLEKSVNRDESELDISKKAYDDLGRVIHEDYANEFYNLSVDYTYNEDGSYYTHTETDFGTWWENYFDADGTLIKTVSPDTVN